MKSYNLNKQIKIQVQSNGNIQTHTTPPKIKTPKDRNNKEKSMDIHPMSQPNIKMNIHNTPLSQGTATNKYNNSTIK